MQIHTGVHIEVAVKKNVSIGELCVDKQIRNSNCVIRILYKYRIDGLRAKYDVSEKRQRKPNFRSRNDLISVRLHRQYLLSRFGQTYAVEENIIAQARESNAW